MTLPFVSYGGSSLIAAGIAVGMLLALTRTRPQGEIGDILAAGALMAARAASADRRRRHRRAHVPRPGAGRGDAGARLAGEAVDRCARRALCRRLSPEVR
jgi:hypothetical protein